VGETTPTYRPDLTRPARIHVIGVGGTGMSAIATVLAAMGHRVTGSDLKKSPSVERLAAVGVATSIGHDPVNVGDAEMVTASSAVPADNPELVEAARRGLPVLRRAQVLAGICATRRSICIAGTHGKTTTSSMLALVMSEAGLHPSFVIGGDINDVGAGGVWDPAGDWIVVEADESDGTFLELPAEAAMVTSVEPDHLDFYGGVEGMESAYAAFLAQAPGPRVVCADDPSATRLGRQVGDVLTYGVAIGADYSMSAVVSGRDGVSFDLAGPGHAPLGRVVLAVPGVHNARNAAAAVAMAMAVGVDFQTAERALGRYGGVARRFEFRGERDGVTYVDDYGHLPGEVRSALAAARDGGWERVVAVFQPHRYSRTEALWAQFADAFVDADVVVITDVYAAGEAPRPGVTGRLIAGAVAAAHPHADVRYYARHDELVAALRHLLGSGDLCLTLGAGDLTVVPSELLGDGG
jgi:UDP-N-acetylmuramate--alanine ligase